MKKMISIIMLFFMLISFSSCRNIESDNLTEMYARKQQTGNEGSSIENNKPDDAFGAAVSKFSIELLKKNTVDNNIIMSPFSALIALGMLSEGAEGDTLSELENVLGITSQELSSYISAYINDLPQNDEVKIDISNSLWIKKGSNVKDSFLESNIDCYRADVFATAFDDSTVKDINKWIDDKTNGMIPHMLEKIDPETLMCLVNTVLFDAEWENKYNSENVPIADFTCLNGTTKKVEMMFFEENMYFVLGEGEGFIKHYKNRRYSFVGILPNNNVDIDEYIESLDGNALREAVANFESVSVQLRMPIFEYEYEAEFTEISRAMGLDKVFKPGEADFSGITDDVDLYVQEILHKAKITNDANGTKAAASTVIGLPASGAPPKDYKVITLDRPFVYFIYDNVVGIPIFVGAVTDIGK